MADGDREPSVGSAGTAASVRFRLALVGVALLADLLLGACSQSATELSMAAHDGSAATSTARLALDQHTRGRLTTPALKVTLGDVATEVATAQSHVAELVPSGTEQRDSLRSVQEALAASSAALATARSALAAGGDLAGARAAVVSSEDELRRVVATLGPPR